MTSSFNTTFDEFVQAYVTFSNTENKGLLTEFDSEWPSPCLQSNADNMSSGDECTWQPQKRSLEANLSNLSSALEIAIPEDYERLFCRYVSLDLNAQHPRGPVTLLQIWSEQDFERFQKNLIAHVLMKRRLKLPDTLFFALTDQDDLIISLDVATQKVVLEPIGKAASETLSNNLTDFIAALKPLPQFVSL